MDLCHVPSTLVCRGDRHAYAQHSQDQTGPPWIDLPVMYGFTILGFVAPSKAPATVIAPAKEAGS